MAETKFEPWSAQLQTLTPWTPLGREWGLHWRCYQELPTQAVCYSPCSHPNSKGHRGSLQLVNTKSKITPILQLGVWSLESFHSTEGGCSLKTPPPSRPTSPPNQPLWTQTANVPPSNLLIKLWRNFRLAIQIVTEAELFSTVTHLLDFQREFDIGRCVLINRNIVIVISSADYEKK